VVENLTLPVKKHFFQAYKNDALVKSLISDGAVKIRGIQKKGHDYGRTGS
jgi:hypothetical protein